MKFSSLAALEVVKMTTSSGASDENFVKMMTFSFQCTAETPQTQPVKISLKKIKNKKVNPVLNNKPITSMGQCKKDVTPLLTHWSYVFRGCHEIWDALVFRTSNMALTLVQTRYLLVRAHLCNYHLLVHRTSVKSLARQGYKSILDYRTSVSATSGLSCTHRLDISAGQRPFEWK